MSEEGELVMVTLREFGSVGEEQVSLELSLDPRLKPTDIDRLLQESHQKSFRKHRNPLVLSSLSRPASDTMLILCSLRSMGWKLVTSNCFVANSDEFHRMFYFEQSLVLEGKVTGSQKALTTAAPASTNQQSTTLHDSMDKRKQQQLSSSTSNQQATTHPEATSKQKQQQTPSRNQEAVQSEGTNKEKQPQTPSSNHERKQEHTPSSSTKPKPMSVFKQLAAKRKSAAQSEERKEGSKSPVPSSQNARKESSSSEKTTTIPIANTHVTPTSSDKSTISQKESSITSQADEISGNQEHSDDEDEEGDSFNEISKVPKRTSASLLFSSVESAKDQSTDNKSEQKTPEPLKTKRKPGRLSIVQLSVGDNFKPQMLGGAGLPKMPSSKSAADESESSSSSGPKRIHNEDDTNLSKHILTRAPSFRKKQPSSRNLKIKKGNTEELREKLMQSIDCLPRPEQQSGAESGTPPDSSSQSPPDQTPKPNILKEQESVGKKDPVGSKEMSVSSQPPSTAASDTKPPPPPPPPTADKLKTDSLATPQNKTPEASSEQLGRRRSSMSAVPPPPPPPPPKKKDPDSKPPPPPPTGMKSSDIQDIPAHKSSGTLPPERPPPPHPLQRKRSSVSEVPMSSPPPPPPPPPPPKKTTDSTPPAVPPPRQCASENSKDPQSPSKSESSPAESAVEKKRRETKAKNDEYFKNLRQGEKEKEEEQKYVEISMEAQEEKQAAIEHDKLKTVHYSRLGASFTKSPGRGPGPGRGRITMKKSLPS